MTSNKPSIVTRTWFAIGWPLLVGLGVAFFMGGPNFIRSADLAGDVRARPKIAVINIAASVKALPPGSSTAELDAVLARAKQDARRLRAAGYIVLYSRNVYAYPKAFEVLP